MKFTLLKLAVLAAASFILLSVISGYEIKAVGTINWQIILMLTPYGLIENLLLGANTYLYPYYFGEMPRAELNWITLLWIFIVQIPISKLCLSWLKSNRHR